MKFRWVVIDSISPVVCPRLMFVLHECMTILRATMTCIRATTITSNFLKRLIRHDLADVTLACEDKE